MPNFITLKAEVVDRAGFGLLHNTNGLWLANRPKQHTVICRVRLNLANHSGPMRDWRLNTGPDHKRIGVRYG